MDFSQVEGRSVINGWGFMGKKWLVMSCMVEYKVNSKTKMIDEIKLGISLSIPGWRINSKTKKQKTKI